MLEKGDVVVIKSGTMLEDELRHLQGLRGIVERVDSRVQRPVVVSFEGFVEWYDFDEGDLVKVDPLNPFNILSEGLVTQASRQLQIQVAQAMQKRIRFEKRKVEIIDAGGDQFYVAVHFKLERCAICNRFMAKIPDTGHADKGKLTDLKIAYPKFDLGHDRWACNHCYAEGLVGFTCYICKQKRATDMIHEQYDDDFICTHCYETVPTKQMGEIEKELRDLHYGDWQFLPMAGKGCVMEFQRGQIVYLKNMGIAAEYIALVELNGNPRHVVKTTIRGDEVWDMHEDDLQAEPIWCPHKGEPVYKIVRHHIPIDDEGKGGFIHRTQKRGVIDCNSSYGQAFPPPASSWWVKFYDGSWEHVQYSDLLPMVEKGVL